MFENIISNLNEMINSEKVKVSFRNESVNRLFNVFEVLLFPKGRINHVTGDIDYITLALPKKRTILTIHDISKIYFPLKRKNKFLGSLIALINKWWFYRIPVMVAGYITVNSETTKTELLKHVNCPPEKIEVIYPPLNPIYSYTPHQFNEEKPIILQVGTIPNKNIPTLAKALEGIPCKLEIIGKPDTETLELLEKYKIDFNWEVGLTNETVLQRYIDCDMVCFASIFEGFGIPIIEAQAIGRPLITSNISSMPEVAGKGACLVDPYDSASIREGILTVINDKKYRENLVEEGLINSHRFSLDAVSDSYYKLYKKVWNFNYS